MAINPFMTEAQVSQKIQEMGTKMSAIIKNYRGVSAASYQPKVRHPIVSFIADDGNKEISEWFTPLFRDRDIRCTLAIIGNRVGGSLMMTLDDILSHYDEGFDIANHTFYHLRDFNYDEYEVNVSKGRLFLNKYGIECPMFVSPFGEGGWRLEIVKKYHDANFITSLGNHTNPSPITTYAISRASIDGQTLSDHKNYVDMVESNGGWLVFAIHPAYSEYTDDPGYLSRRQDVEDVIDYIISKDIPILTAKQGFDYYKNYVEIGSKIIDQSYYLMGMDGSEEGDFLNDMI